MQLIASVLLVVLLASGCSLFKGSEESVSTPDAPPDVTAEPDAPDASDADAPPGANNNAPVDDGTWSMDPQVVLAGDGTVALSILLPDGWHINTDAPPFQATWKVDGVVVQMDEADQAMRLVDPIFPLHVPVTLTAGDAEVAVKIQVFYCNDDQTLCTVERRTLFAPLSVGTAGTGSDFEISYTIVPPEVP